MSKKTGFTLIELLVVIAIIALLLAIIIPSLKTAKDYAKRVICASRLRQTGIAMRSYSMSYEYLPDALDNTGKDSDDHGYAVYRGDKPQWLDSKGKPIALRWAKMYEAGFVDIPENFYCPGNRMDSYKYESYTSPSAWGTLPQNYNAKSVSNQWVRVGYTYYPISKNPTISPITHAPVELPKKFIQLHATLPYATDILHGRSNLSHQKMQDSDDVFHESNKYSVNALYSDAHVSNCNDPEVFKDTIWDRFRTSQAGYDEYYFTVFRSIGQ